MKKYITGLMAMAVLATALLMPATASAVVCGQGDTTPKGQVLTGAGQTGTDCSGTQVNTTIAAVIQVLSFVVGIAAVIVIILSGLKYVTSGGDSGKISSAKTSLIFALIGLAIAALAQILVNFVFDTVKTTPTPPPKTSLLSTTSLSTEESALEVGR